MNNFRTLNIAIEMHLECRKVKAPSYLRNQLDRASSSVVLNLSEGRGKRSVKDQARFFDIAMGSLRETQIALKLCDRADHAIVLADKTGAYLYNLLKSMGLN